MMKIEILPMRRRPRVGRNEEGGGRYGTEKQREKKELRCVTYVYKLPMIIVIIMYYKRANKK